MFDHRNYQGMFLFFILTLVPVFAYKHFQLQIPNGEMVPHPCKPNFMWRGVGHENHLGGGARNPFGVDFKENNYQWTLTLCLLDSDGDGKTNGEELGDPNCTWTPGTKPPSSYNLSHPGICQPFDSDRCGGKPDFVDCEHVKFECDALHEDGVFNFTVRMPKTPVPAKETTYMCMIFEFPNDTATEYHIIADLPQIDNADVMHHIVVSGCNGDISAPLNQPYECGMSAGYGCSDIIGTWAVGIPGECFNSESGFLIGGSKGYRFGSVQYHWNNPAEVQNHMDGSGITFYATPNLRPHDAGVMVIGQMHLIIPPGKEEHIEKSRCESQCTQKSIKDEITITSVFNHMHYLGKSQITELHRRDESIEYIGKDESYSYDSPVVHHHVTGIKVYPGDELATTCIFKSTSRTVTTFFGDGTQDEMCFSFLTYFPKQNLTEQSCFHFGDSVACGLDEGIIAGCRAAHMYEKNHPAKIEIWNKVEEKCTPGICRHECKEYAREVKQKPCYSGGFDQVYRLNVARRNDHETLSWYAALDSCDKELSKEACVVRGTNSAGAVVPAAMMIVPMYLFTIYI